MKLAPSVLSVAVGLSLISPVVAQTPTKVPSTDPKFYETQEAALGKSVLIVNAQYAYSRGWTGLGSTVLIMDTGVNEAHVDLAGKIVYKRNFTVKTPDENVRDDQGHGTHVAGIVAARKNDLVTKGTVFFGSHGIAYDANLAIAKIATKTNFNMGLANTAMAWASQYSDVVVANLSANVNYAAAYTAASRQVAPGLFVNTHAQYGGTKYYNLETPYAYKIPESMVLTVSAGNTNLGYVQSPAVFATATDAQGNLVHGGRMLVVGNWNAGLKVIEGAKSGHMCKDFSNGTCNDRYRTSDFYILAPGAGVYSTAFNNNTLTRSMSGTSQAAPVVAGAIAIINQMWPYMTPANQVQLLLKTANKNLPGYSVNTHGQGLLDLDAATRPVGALGISTTGRTGKTSPIAEISVAGGAPVIGGGSSVSAVDEFQRDFLVDLSPAIRSHNFVADPAVLQHRPGQSWSGRLSSMYTQRARGATDNVSISLDSGHFGYHGPSKHQITLTRMDQNPWINYSGSWGNVNYTTALEYNYVWDRDNTWFQVGAIQTDTAVAGGMVQRINPIRSLHGTVGYRSGKFSIYAGIQPYIIEGSMDLIIPTSTDTNGVMNYTHSQTQLSGRDPVGYMGINWYKDLTRSSSFHASTVANQTGQYLVQARYIQNF